MGCVLVELQWIDCTFVMSLIHYNYTSRSDRLLTEMK